MSESALDNDPKKISHQSSGTAGLWVNSWQQSAWKCVVLPQYTDFNGTIYLQIQETHKMERSTRYGIKSQAGIDLCYSFVSRTISFLD